MPEKTYKQEATGDSVVTSLTPAETVYQSLPINFRETTPVDLYFLLKEAFESHGLSVSQSYYPDSKEGRSEVYRLDFYISDPSATPDEFENKYRVRIRGSINGVDEIYFKAVEKRMRLFEQRLRGICRSAGVEEIFFSDHSMHQYSLI